MTNPTQKAGEEQIALLREQVDADLAYAITPRHRDRATALTALLDDHARMSAELERYRKAFERPIGEMRLSSLVKDLVIPVVEADFPIGTKLYAAPTVKES